VRGWQDEEKNVCTWVKKKMKKKKKKKKMRKKHVKKYYKAATAVLPPQHTAVPTPPVAAWTRIDWPDLNRGTPRTAPESA
jgi:hypothetical protein